MNRQVGKITRMLRKPETWVAVIVAYIIYKSLSESFIQPSLRSPVGAIPEGFRVEPTAPLLNAQASKITVVGTNLSHQRRGLLSAAARGGVTRESTNISQDIRGVHRREKFENNSAGNIFNASELNPESGVRNRYL